MARRKKASTKLAINIVKRKKRPRKTVKKKSLKREKEMADLLEEKKTVKGKSLKRRKKRQEEKEVPFDGVSSYEKLEKEKRMIMWSGVTFFMILVIVFWAYNVKQIFVAMKIESKESEFQIDSWKEMTQDIGNQIKEIKDVVGEFKDVEIEKEVEEGEYNQISTLPTNDSVEFVDASSSTEVAGTSSDMLVE